MSRIGKKPVPVPDGVKVAIEKHTIRLEGPRGKLHWNFDRSMKVTYEDQKRLICVARPDDARRHKALHGLTRALIQNMVIGVTQGYERAMELYGTGYSVNVQGRKLVTTCGFAHPVEMTIPAGVEVTVEAAATRGNETPARFTIRSCDKQLVGEFAAEVRHVRPPEPYLGKGFRYRGEAIRRKAGKTFVGTAG